MYSISRIFHPARFQGSLNKTKYFEGWYFKHVAADTGDAFAVIPGVSLSSDSHAFVQFADGSTGRSEYFRYDVKDFIADNKSFRIKIGNNVFSSEGIGLDLRNNDYYISGKLDYTHMKRLKPTLLRPGIMGWYSYVPGMECNHGVISLNHFLGGSIYINGIKKDFSGGKGYIEKDWGTSFPESWFWIQCNNFRDEYISLMISVAKIPWKGSFFIGFLGFLFFRGETEIFATYNFSKVDFLKKIADHKSEIQIKKRNRKLRVLVSGRDSSSLKAPHEGQMINRIKESLNARLFLEYSINNKIVYSGSGIRAGFEETEGIYKYF